MKRLLVILLASCGAVYAQQNALLLPWTPQQFTNTNGTVLANGKVCTYLAGTSTGVATYTDSTASVANNIPPNAILLDSTGRPTSGGIWLKPTQAYKIIVLTAGSDSTCNTGVTIKTQDNVGISASVSANNTFTGTNAFTGPTQFTEGTPAGGAVGQDTCQGSSAAHSLQCNYNNGGFFNVPLVGLAETWAGIQSFNSGTIVPSAAGGTDLGSTTLPFGNLWLGTAATNNFKLQPAAVGGQRIISIPDPGANSNLTLTPCITSQRTETAADANLLTCAIPAQAGSYRIRFVLSVSASNAATLGWTATWTDSNGTAQAPTNIALLGAGSTGSATSSLTQTISVNTTLFGFADVDVNNAGTSIVVKLTFSGTSFTGKASATVERII